MAVMPDGRLLVSGARGQFGDKPRVGVVGGTLSYDSSLGIPDRKAEIGETGPLPGIELQIEDESPGPAGEREPEG